MLQELCMDQHFQVHSHIAFGKYSIILLFIMYSHKGSQSPTLFSWILLLYLLLRS